MLRNTLAERRPRLWHRLSFLIPIAACAVIIVAVYVGMLYAYNVFPFSDRTASQYDLLAQIVPYAEHLFDVWKGEASLFYTTRVGGGMDVFGILMYCLLSPFTFLFFLFGEGNVYYAASVMIPAKLVCIAAAGVVMMRVRFRDMSLFLVVPAAVLYAFCGFMFVANTYINWMDLLMYMPLGVLAFGYMRRTGRVRWLACVIAACIYTCFSLFCFSMFVSYPVFVAYGLIVMQKEERKGYLFRISLAYLCGILAAFPVMVPSLLAFLRSGRGGDVFEFLWSSINVNSYLQKISYIVSDAFFVILIAVYFIGKRFRDRESRFLGVAALLIMMPVLVDEVCKFMNMGSYLAYALRFGFLNAIYELYVACLVLEKVRFFGKTRFMSQAESALRDGTSYCRPSTDPFGSEESGKTDDCKAGDGHPMADGVSAKIFSFSSDADGMSASEEIKEKGEIFPAVSDQGGEERELSVEKAIGREKALRREWILFAVLLSATLLALIVIYQTYCVTVGEGVFDFSFWPALESVFEWMIDMSVSFSSSFAHSLGGLGGVAAVFIAVALVAVPAILFYKFRLVRLQLIYPCMAVVLFAQTAFLGAQLVGGNVFNPIRYNEYNSLYAQVMTQEDEENHYRVKDYGAYLSDNQTLITDSSSYSFFSSVADEDNYAPTEVFGYNSNGINALKSGGGTVFGDCLLGYKYYFYQTEYGAEPNREYLVARAREAHFAMYENTIVFPSAFTLSKSDMGVTTEYDNYFENMQNLYEFLGGEGDVFTTYSIPTSDISYSSATDPDTGKTYRTVFVKVRIRESGDISFFSQLPTDKGLRYYTTSIGNSFDVSEVKTYTYHDADPGRWYYMYLYSTDPDYELTIEEVREKCSIKVISVDTLAALFETLWERAVKYTVENTLLSTTYRAEVTAEAGQYLFLNSIAVKGLKVYVNGEEKQFIDNGLNMMLLPLEAGENKVEIVYTSEYPVYGLITGGVALALLLLIAFILKKRENWVRVLEKPVAALSLWLAGAVVVVFMVIPTLAFLVKLIFW